MCCYRSLVFKSCFEKLTFHNFGPPYKYLEAEVYGALIICRVATFFNRVFNNDLCQGRRLAIRWGTRRRLSLRFEEVTIDYVSLQALTGFQWEWKRKGKEGKEEKGVIDGRVMEGRWNEENRRRKIGRKNSKWKFSIVSSLFRSWL